MSNKQVYPIGQAHQVQFAWGVGGGAGNLYLPEDRQKYETAALEAIERAHAELDPAMENSPEVTAWSRIIGEAARSAMDDLAKQDSGDDTAEAHVALITERRAV